MALKSSREGLRKELVDYLGNLIVDDNLRNEIIKIVGDNFVTSEVLNENVNNLTMQITTESGERVEADDTLQNNITAETTAREGADTTLQNNINAETTARQEAIANLEELIVTSGLHVDLLWANASLTTDFVPQTINLDSSSYKYLIVRSKFSIVTDVYTYNIMFNNGKKTTLYGGNSIEDAAVVFRWAATNGTQITFYHGGYISDSSHSIEIDKFCVPIQIYGVK